MDKQPRHELIEQLFHAALALDPDKRSDFLKRSCASDPALLAEVQSLLSEHEQATSFMASPAYEINSELLVASEGSLAGKSLGHFTIQERIGAGGMGEVYRARDTKLGREVAIKVLSEALTQDTLRLKRFEREARMLASLNHSNIATIHSLEEFDGKHFRIWTRLMRARSRPGQACATPFRAASGWRWPQR